MHAKRKGDIKAGDPHVAGLRKGDNSTNSYSILHEEIEKQNRSRDVADRATSADSSISLDHNFLHDTTFSRLSSKRALTLAGGLDHFKDNIRADAAENEQLKRRKVQKRALYDSWKILLIAAKLHSFKSISAS